LPGKSETGSDDQRLFRFDRTRMEAPAVCFNAENQSVTQDISGLSPSRKILPNIS
jgi:hypothetical protein